MKIYGGPLSITSDSRAAPNLDLAILEEYSSNVKQRKEEKNFGKCSYGAFHSWFGTRGGSPYLTTQLL